MNITVKKLSELRKPSRNIRRHSEKQLAEYVRSIKMFGQVKPIVVDEDGEIIAGNGLYEALLRMGAETCDCYVMTGLTAVQKKKLMMADNKVYELGFTDTNAIEALVAELEGDFDVPGWEEDLLQMLDSTIEEADAIVDSYGVFSESDVASINRKPTEEHIPYAETPSYPVAPPPPTAPAPAPYVATPPERPEPPRENAPMSEPIPVESPAPATETDEAPHRYIRCPKCGELICL